MAEKASAIVPQDSESTQAEREAQYRKDRAAFEQRNKETEMLLKQMENIKKID